MPTNFNPALLLEEVSAEILNKNRVKEFTRKESERLKRLHTREGKHFHGVLSYPADAENCETLRKIRDGCLERK